MSGSSPGHSSASANTSGGGGGAGGGSSSSATAAAFVSSDDTAYKFPTDLISAQDRKEEALGVLKTELMAALQKEVKSLDEDSWKFAGPRSQINLISRPGGLLHNQTETAKRWHSGKLVMKFIRSLPA